MIPLRDANPTRRTPVVTIGLVAACLIAFAWELGLQVSGGDEALDAFITAWGVVPADLTAGLGLVRVPERGDADPHHEPVPARRLAAPGGATCCSCGSSPTTSRIDLGRLAFLAFYLGGGAVAGLTQVAIDPASTVPMIGASGAIAAVLGGYLVLYPRARITSLVFLGFFYQLIDVPAVIVLGFWFVLQLIDGLASLGFAGADGGVAFFAHIGGLRGRRRGRPAAADAPPPSSRCGAVRPDGPVG